MKWHSTIKPLLMKQALFRGSSLGMLGVASIFASGSFFYSTAFSFLGFILFAVGLGFITYGLIPYKKLSRLELFPDSIQLQQDCIIYIQGGKPQISIPLNLIKEVSYVEQPAFYGINIELCQNGSEKVSILQKNFNIQKFLLQAPKTGDIFLPYFSSYSYEELREEIF